MKARLEKIVGIRRKKQIEENWNSLAKEECFIRNGAVLLEKQLSLFRGKDLGCEPCKIFSAEDIKRATGNYDCRLLSRRRTATISQGDVGGVRGHRANNYNRRLLSRVTVFKGTIDDRTVAVKTVVGDLPPGLPGVGWLVDFFLNQVAIKQVINHKHIVSLYGCCLETQVPILVLEYFIPGGSLHDHLHRDSPVISWLDRFRIATEISQALAYMHHGTWKPIVHLDVKSSNVFLDENSTAKLSNFGFSVPISPGDEFSQGRSLLGTPGYTDPEYEQTLKVTEKCDVYGFGVLMVELLTSDDPFLLKVNGNARLGDKFVLAMVENSVLEIVDEKISDEAKDEEIQQFSNIAFRCLGKGVDRPTMLEVAGELRQIYHQIIS